MKKILLGILMAIVILGLSGIATASLIPASEKAKGGPKISPPGLEKVVFIHYKKGYGGFCDFDGVCERELGENPSCADCKKDKENGEEESTCYAFLDKWAKWNELPVSYVIDPANPQGLLGDFVTSAISAGAEEWDSWTRSELFNDTYTVIDDGSWDSDAPDGRNELLFGDYPQDGVIAVAIIWGYFTGPSGQRKIIEFDILFDIDWTWGDATTDPAVMDLQNIAVHELGHGAGLGDLYDTVCAEETMYGYSNYGETKKRDLNTGDITGIQKLYNGF